MDRARRRYGMSRQMISSGDASAILAPLRSMKVIVPRDRFAHMRLAVGRPTELRQRPALASTTGTWRPTSVWPRGVPWPRDSVPAGCDRPRTT